MNKRKKITKPHSIERRSKYLLLSILTVAKSSVYLSAQATTALNDNPVASTSGFSNFDGFNLKIDVPAYVMQGQYRFLKIYDDAGLTLFLGEVSPTEIFSIPVHKLKIAKKLTIELFSESSLDNTATNLSRDT